MPKYVYQGLTSGITFELEQRITESALTHHPETNEPVKRLIGRPAISFKGSGFYANDSKGSREAKVAPASDAKQGDAKQGDTKQGDTNQGDAKPSESKAESSSPTASGSAPAKEASSPSATPKPVAAPAKSAD